MNFFALTLTFFFALMSLIAAAPVVLEKRDVFVPPVMKPNSYSVWKIGTTQTVTWDVSRPPKQITNTKGRIVLVKDGILDFDHPLAVDFDIMDGKHKVTVPAVEPGNNYKILVFGDSGNTGEAFSIVA